MWAWGVETEQERWGRVILPSRDRIGQVCVDWRIKSRDSAPLLQLWTHYSCENWEQVLLHSLCHRYKEGLDLKNTTVNLLMNGSFWSSLMPLRIRPRSQGQFLFESIQKSGRSFGSQKQICLWKWESRDFRKDANLKRFSVHSTGYKKKRNEKKEIEKGSISKQCINPWKFPKYCFLTWNCVFLVSCHRIFSRARRA